MTDPTSLEPSAYGRRFFRKIACPSAPCSGCSTCLVEIDPADIYVAEVSVRSWDMFQAAVEKLERIPSPAFHPRDLNRAPRSPRPRR